MGANSDIQWTDHTFNAVEGCEKVSAGCRNCYAEARNNRFSGGANWGPGSPRLLRSPSYWLAPRKWNREAEKAGVRRRVFAGSLCDVCEDHPDWVGPRKQLAQVVLETPWLDWLFVTKRPENYRRLWDPYFGDTWPRNVWAGCTVESQAMADARIPELLRVPAAVRFLSMEPLLEAVDLRRVLWPDKGGHKVDVLRFGFWETERSSGGFVNHSDMYEMFGRPIQWIIVGFESGPRARPGDLAWVRSLAEQAEYTNTKLFIKQLGSNPVHGPGGKFRLPLGDSHGGDESEWPADLRGRRAFPAVPT